MCDACGYVSDGKNTRLCPECKKKLVELSAECVSTVRERTVIPGVGECNLLFSIEAIQDMKVAQVALQAYRASEPSAEEIELWEKLSDRHAFGRIRTVDPTEDEVKDWQKYDKFFAELDHAEVLKRYNVHMIREEEPYEDYDYNDEYSWFKQ
jgi:hypothetical protein